MYKQNYHFMSDVSIQVYNGHNRKYYIIEITSPYSYYFFYFKAYVQYLYILGNTYILYV